MAIISCGIVVREPTTAVALLTWTYRNQKADLMSGRDLHHPGGELPVPGGPRPGLAPSGWLRPRIRSTGHLQRPALHPDAEAVHDLVVQVSWTDPAGARLVRDYARLGEIPESGDTSPRPGPVYRRTGNNRLRIVEDGDAPAAFCPLRYVPSLDSVAEARAEYAAWWAALERIAAALPPLRRWQLTGLGAAEAPWQWQPDLAGHNRPSGRIEGYFPTIEKST